MMVYQVWYLFDLEKFFFDKQERDVTKKTAGSYENARTTSMTDF